MTWPNFQSCVNNIPNENGFAIFYILLSEETLLYIDLDWDKKYEVEV